MTFPSTPWPVATLVVVLGILALGCGLLPGAADQGPGISVLNPTSKAVEIHHSRLVGTVYKDDLIIEIAANQRAVVRGLGLAKGECLRGTLIVIQDGRSIAAFGQPCDGTEWVIPAASASPAST